MTTEKNVVNSKRPLLIEASIEWVWKTKFANFKTFKKFSLLSFKSKGKASVFGKIDSKMKLINNLEGIIDKPQEKLSFGK